MYSINNRFIPQALITLLFSLPGFFIYYEKLYFLVVVYFMAILYIFANALSNYKYFANIEPINFRALAKRITKKSKIINNPIPNKGVTMDKTIMEDLKGSMSFIDLLIDGSILAALFPSFRSLVSTIAANGTAAEIALSALIPLLLVVAFVYMVYHQVKKK
jgi:hypothetical protein